MKRTKVFNFQLQTHPSYWERRGWDEEGALVMARMASYLEENGGGTIHTSNDFSNWTY